MTELQQQRNSPRPVLGRSFLSGIKAGCNLKGQLIFWLLLTGGLVLDLWSKQAVFNWLSDGGSVSVINGFLRLVTAQNAGAAFGIATGQRYLLVLVSVLALIVIFAILLFSRAEQNIVHIALGLFAAGVCGNLWDRIFNNGLVRDFIDIYYGRHHWPAFNVADSMLCIAVGLMIISGFTGWLSQKRAQQRK